MWSILSWNIQYGKGVDGKIDLARIAAAIQETGDVDVICLQEVSRNDPGADEGADQMDKLAELFPDYQHFFGQVHNRRGRACGKRKQFGNLVLTRTNPEQILYHQLPSPPDPKARFMARQATELTLEQDGSLFRIVNTHLEYFSEQQQLSQVQRLRELHEESCGQFYRPGHDMPCTPFEQVPRPPEMILCGDFNFTPESLSYRKMTSGFPVEYPDLHDAWMLLFPDSPRDPTCGVFDYKQWEEGPHCRDYFFISSPVRSRLKTMKVNLKTFASDHQPIMLELEG